MEIQLCGYTVLIDDEDFVKINNVKWHIHMKSFREKGLIYFQSNYYIDKHQHSYILHRVILGLRLHDGLVCDHINGNTLDNRKCNLRVCTIKENTRNQKLSIRNTTGYKGVCYLKKQNKYLASIAVDNTSIHLGVFNTAQEAYIAYCKASSLYHKEFGRVK